MRLRSMLVLTWLLFAGLATAAGFAAVGLVGQGLTVASAPETGPSVTAPATTTTTTAPAKATAKATPKPTAKLRKSTQRATTATPGTRQPTRSGPVKRTASRSVRGNYVSATCRGDSVTMSASPAPGWRLDEYRPGPAHEARAKFHSDHDEVKVEVTCSAGRPVFKIED